MTRQRTTFRVGPQSDATARCGDLAATDTEQSGWDWESGFAYAWRRRRLVFAFVAAATITAALYNVLSPDRFTARATLLPPRPPGKLSSLASLAPGLLSMAGAMVPSDLSNGTDLYPTILHSESVIRPLLNKTFPVSRSAKRGPVTLAALVKTDDPQLGVERVRRLLKTTVTRRTGTCRLSVTLEDPVTAAAVCNTFVDALAARGVQLRTSSASRMEQFIAERLKTVKGELTKAEKDLEVFRSRNRNYNYASNPELQTVDERLVRQVTLKSQLYLQLSQEYEMARIEENRDVADIRVLDEATVPTVKSGPHRVRSTLLAGLTSGPVAVMALLLWQFLQVSLRPRVPSEWHGRFNRFRREKNRCAVEQESSVGA